MEATRNDLSRVPGGWDSTRGSWLLYTLQWDGAPGKARVSPLQTVRAARRQPLTSSSCCKYPSILQRQKSDWLHMASRPTVIFTLPFLLFSSMLFVWFLGFFFWFFFFELFLSTHLSTFWMYPGKARCPSEFWGLVHSFHTRSHIQEIHLGRWGEL